MGMSHFQICYYNDISETNVTMFYDREFQGFLLVMKLVRMKQKRDFWRRNNNKKGQEKNLFSPPGTLGSFFWNCDRKGILSSSLILHPLALHLFLSTISDLKKKCQKCQNKYKYLGSKLPTATEESGTVQDMVAWFLFTQNMTKCNYHFLNKTSSVLIDYAVSNRFLALRDL